MLDVARSPASVVSCQSALRHARPLSAALQGQALIAHTKRHLVQQGPIAHRVMKSAQIDG